MKVADRVRLPDSPPIFSRHRITDNTWVFYTYNVGSIPAGEANLTGENMKVIKFSASWCQPCKFLSKMLERDPLGVEVEEVDIDENSDMANQFKVRSVPTLVLMKDGVEVDRIMGTHAPAAIRNKFGLVA